jgi:hypothetical protein
MVFVRRCTYTHAHKEKREGAENKMKENDLVSVEAAIANGAEKVV